MQTVSKSGVEVCTSISENSMRATSLQVSDIDSLAQIKDLQDQLESTKKELAKQLQLRRGHVKYTRDLEGSLSLSSQMNGDLVEQNRALLQDIQVFHSDYQFVRHHNMILTEQMEKMWAGMHESNAGFTESVVPTIPE
jgi:hypothetical protein